MEGKYTNTFINKIRKTKYETHIKPVQWKVGRDILFHPFSLPSSLTSGAKRPISHLDIL